MSIRFIAVVLIACVTLSSSGLRADDVKLRTGPWRAWLDSPGGDLPFGVEMVQANDTWRAWMITGPQRLEVPTVTWNGKELVLGIDHFASKIVARPTANGARLDGEWSKRGRGDSVSRLPFHATVGEARRFPVPKSQQIHVGLQSVAGKWLATFSESEKPLIGVFRQDASGSVNGTFLTPTGDYGYIAGYLDGSRLRLSSFDGAHAFLFDATLQPDGTLKGDFWSRDAWHETWTAHRDASAKLPDAFAQTTWTDKAKLDDLVFPDLTGSPRSLNDPAFVGKARIIEVFGSWCPNCHDATNLLVEYHKKYANRGLKILGLAFEMSEDAKLNTEQVKKYLKHHDVKYPVLVAGMAKREVVAEVFPVLDKLRSYPTTIFLDGNGKVHAIHTGFSGPATGEEHTKLRADFERIIEGLLGN